MCHRLPDPERTGAAWHNRPAFFPSLQLLQQAKVHKEPYSLLDEQALLSLKATSTAPSKPLFPVHSLKCAKRQCMLTFLTLTADTNMRTNAASACLCHTELLCIPCWQLHCTANEDFHMCNALGHVSRGMMLGMISCVQRCICSGTDLWHQL